MSIAEPLPRVRLLALRIKYLISRGFGTRQRILLYAFAAGLAGAFAAAAFKYATVAIQFFFTGSGGGYVQTFRGLEWWERILIPTVGGVFAGAVLYFGRRFVSNRSTGYMEAVALGDGDVPMRPTLLRSASALFSIASGEAIGREGPLAQLAAASASFFGRLLREPPARLRLLVACGAASGLAAAYNAPLASAFFVAEIIIGSISMESFGPILLASVTSAVATRLIDGGHTLYPIAFAGDVPVAGLGIMALAGVACGLAAPLFISVLDYGRRVFRRFNLMPVASLAIGGLIVGIMAAWRPEIVGNGQSVIREMFAGQYVWQFVLVLMVIKVLAVASVFGSGAVGGVFTPSLLVGASIGYLLGAVVCALGYTDVPPECYSAVGMGAFLCAVMQAPVMAIVMIFEMTLCPVLIVPLVVASVAAYFTVRAFKGGSLYVSALKNAPSGVFDRDMAELRVGEILRPKFSSLKTGSHLGEITAAFMRSTDGLIPVVGEDGTYLGSVLLVTIRPFLRDVDIAAAVIASDIMHDDVPTLDVGADLPEALRAFACTKLNALPVTDAGTGRVAGLLSRADLYITVSELTRRQSY
jgi:chloride channel protein, CIC family